MFTFLCFYQIKLGRQLIRFSCLRIYLSVLSRVRRKLFELSADSMYNETAKKYAEKRTDEG